MRIKNNNNSKELILEIACKLFSEKGFEGTTVRNICEKANTYQLSINYHFGSKDNLYKEAFLLAYQYTELPATIKKIQHLSIEEKLKELFKIELYSILSEDKRGYFYKIMAIDQVKINSLMDELYDQIYSPYLDILKDIMTSLTGEEVFSFKIKYILFTIFSQLITLNQDTLLRNWLLGDYKKERIPLSEIQNLDIKNLKSERFNELLDSMVNLVLNQIKVMTNKGGE